MAEAVEILFHLVGIIRSDPRIGWALLVLLAAGVLMAILIRRTRRDEFPRIGR